MKILLKNIKIIISMIFLVPHVSKPLYRALQLQKPGQIRQLTPAQKELLAKQAVMRKTKFKEESELLSTALDKINQGTFDQYYYEVLKPEYDASLKDKSIGPGKLRTLMNLAEKQSDKTLSAFLATYFLPIDMQKMLMVPQIMEPVTHYIKNEIYKKGKLYSTILYGHGGPRRCVDIAKDGLIIATGGESSNNLIIWNGQTGELLKTFIITEGSVKEVILNNDGSKVLARVSIQASLQEFFDETDITKAQKKEIVLLYDTKKGSLIKKFENLLDNYIFQSEFDSQGNRIIFTRVNVDPEVLDITPIMVKSHIEIVDSATGSTIAIHETGDSVPSVTINPNGNTVIINGLLYDFNDGKKLKKLEGITSDIIEKSYSQNGNKIIAREPNTAKTFIWDGTTGDLDTEFDSIGWNISLSADGSKMVSINIKEISLWDVASKTKLLSIATESTPTYIQLSNDGSLIAASYDGGAIDIWNAYTGEKIHTFNHSIATHAFVDVEFSADGKRLQSHSSPAQDDRENKCTVMLWDIQTGRHIYTFLAKHELLDMDENFLTIVSPDGRNPRNFLLWKSLSSDEESALKELENITIAQAQFLYQLYKAKESNNVLMFSEDSVFRGLSHSIQTIIKKYLNTEKITKQIVQPTPFMQPPLRIEEPEIEKSRFTTQTLEEIGKTAKTWWEWLTGQ